MPGEEEAVVEKRVVPRERMCLGTDWVTAKRKGSERSVRSTTGAVKECGLSSV